MSTAIPTLTLFRRHSVDVPEDIDDVLEHLNDPNWDFNPPSPTLTGTSYDEHKMKEVEPSRYSSSDFDTESHAESSYGKSATAGTSTFGKTEHSKSQLWSSAAGDLEDDSPYPEVRAAVSNTDDPSTPVNTFRMWFLGLTLSIFASSINQFMTMRSSQMTLTALVIQVIALPLGKFLAWALPTRRFTTFGYTWSFNPGPFNVKEHTVITAMTNVTWQTPYVLSVFLAQRIDYAQNPTYKYRILLALSTQLIGIAYAGLFRSILVWPSNMIYPGTLVSCSLMNTLHRAWGKRETKHLSRHLVFTLVTLGAALWYFVPGFLFTGLSLFSWITYIAPNNPGVNVVFGGLSGLGIGAFSLDWSMITLVSQGSPLVSPWWAQLNIYGAFILIAWVIAPILYFKNVLFAKFMPISSTQPFDNTGLPYDVTLILTNGTFDEDKYQAYSPMFLSTTNALGYATCFAVLPAAVVHTFIWYGRDIIRQFRNSLADYRDVHSRLMMAYSEVPMWWYGLLFIFCFVAGAVGVEIFPVDFPIWLLVVSIVIPVALIIPIGIIRAVTNQWLTLTFFAELLGGYVVPGKPVAFMLFKTYLGFPTDQASTYLADLKMGHYMKVPPRIMFLAQTSAVFVTTFICEAILTAIINHEGDAVCTEASNFSCPSDAFFAQSAAIWGAVGSKRLFGVGQMYNPFLWIILIGAFLPIPLYLLARRYPYSRWRYVNIPAALSSAFYFPPTTGLQFTSWFIVGAVFQGYLRRMHFRWWMRYNYVIAAALDAGLAFGTILVFLFFALPKGGVTLSWWGNDVTYTTLDANAMPFIALEPNSTFGPSQW